MKFNEKLIELRKKEGLSQEELGYKLNVTRQTVSKWELGQTKPEMDKLVEMSKIFNVSLDELVNETEVEINKETIIEDQHIHENKNRKNNKKILIILMCVIAVILIFVTPIIISKVANGIVKLPQNFIESFFGMVDNIEEEIEDFEANNPDNFNRDLEIKTGRNSKNMTLEVLDIIITNNKKQDRKITVKYMEIETQNPDEIKDIKLKLEDFAKYEISYDYDKEGFINKATIEKVESQDSQIFNNSQEFFNNSQEFINSIQSEFENFNF